MQLTINQTSELNRILMQCVRLNNYGKTEVFFDYAPPVKELRIKVYKEGWEENDDPDISLYTYFKDDEYDEIQGSRFKTIESTKRMLDDVEMELSI